MLPFAQIEVGPLGHPLPHQARQRRQRWCNDGTEPHAWYGWLRVGWFVGPISLATEMVSPSPGATTWYDETEQGEQRRVATAPELDGPTVVA